MNLTISPAALSGSVYAPLSKSLAHRFLICAALADAPSSIEAGRMGDDIIATADCLSRLGAGLSRDGGGLCVTPIKTAPEKAVLNCRGSGSTLRFLLPAAALLTKSCTFTGGDSLAARPVKELLDAMRENGALISQNTLPLTVSGGLLPGRYELAGNVSSQYITGLLLALPLLEGESEIALSTALSSAPYVEMTLEVLKTFGVFAKKTQNGFKIDGKQRFSAPKSPPYDGDWSAAAVFLSAGALMGEVRVNGLSANSHQGDRRIIDYLRLFGADAGMDGDSAFARKSELHACEIDLTDTPDLFAVLAVLASFAKGESRFTGISRLKFKESDRIRSVSDMLMALGGGMTVSGDSVRVCGSALSGGTVDCRGDHRIAMAAAVAAGLCAGKTTLLGADCVSKSYPDFWRDHAALGGRAEL